jgi:hypothetical protein
MPPLFEPRLYRTSCRGDFDLELTQIVSLVFDEIHLASEAIGWDQICCQTMLDQSDNRNFAQSIRTTHLRALRGTSFPTEPHNTAFGNTMSITLKVHVKLLFPDPVVFITGHKKQSRAISLKML